MMYTTTRNMANRERHAKDMARNHSRITQLLWWLAVPYEEVTIPWKSVSIENTLDSGTVITTWTSNPKLIHGKWLRDNLGRENRDWQLYSRDSDHLVLRVRKENAAALSLFLLTET